MAPRGYRPIASHQTASLRSSKLFDTPAPEPPVRILLHFLGSKGTLAVLVFLALVAMMQLPRSSSSWALGDDASWEELFNASSRGWRPFEPSQRSPGAQEHQHQLTGGQLWPDDCIDAWVARGKLCEQLKEGGLRAQEKVDLLWTYTNGSDPLLQNWRVELTAMLTGRPSSRSQASLNGRVRPELVRIKEVQGRKHFREHDELRYSLRAALSAFLRGSVGRVALLTTDLPTGTLLHDLVTRSPSNISTDLVSTTRVAQVPTWLVSAINCSTSEPPLEMVHHTSIFDDKGNTPTFNSLAIESQLANMQGLSEFVLYMNDDTFLLGADSFTPADVGSPLYGPVFRLQRDFTVNGISPDDFAGDAEGEWPGLHRANWLLNRRFGERNRGYLAHIPKSFSTPLLAEVQQLWHEELSETASSRFRGRKLEHATTFLATHYVIEAHRQALLYSFFVLRADSDLDGSLSLLERQRLASDLNFAEGTSAVEGTAPVRDTLRGLQEAFAQTLLEAPRSTEIVFDSRDGFAMQTPTQQFREGTPAGNRHASPTRWPVLAEASEFVDEEEQERRRRSVCSFDWRQCLGADFFEPSAHVLASEVLKRVAFEQPECGDCAIVLLVGKSGTRGLESFLPPASAASSSPAPSTTVNSPLAPLVKDYAALDFSLPDTTPAISPSDARRRALHLIHRYAYAIGDSPSRLVAMKIPHLVDKSLAALDEDKRKGTGLAFVTLNDDIATERGVSIVDQKLASWFAQRWPTPSPYEVE